MMDSFLFSINVTTPIFLIILLGYILRIIKFVNEDFINITNKYVFNIALPVMLFRDIATTNIRNDMDIRFFVFCFVVTIIMFLITWLLCFLLIKDKSIVGAFTQASVRGSAAVLGVAFVQNICGNSGMAPIMIVAAVPLFNMLSVVILTFSAVNNDNNTINRSKKIKDSCINILKNPIIIGILIGILVSLLDFQPPFIATKCVDYLSDTATPMALIAIGAGFDSKKAIAKIKPTMIASFIKLILLPAIFMPLAIYLSFRPSEMIAILIMLASPTTISCYVMAKNMNNDEVLTSSTIITTTVLSSITLTGWIFLLKLIGCI